MAAVCACVDLVTLAGLDRAGAWATRPKSAFSGAGSAACLLAEGAACETGPDFRPDLVCLTELGGFAASPLPMPAEPACGVAAASVCWDGAASVIWACMDLVNLSLVAGGEADGDSWATPFSCACMDLVRLGEGNCGAVSGTVCWGPALGASCLLAAPVPCCWSALACSGSESDACVSEAVSG